MPKRGLDWNPPGLNNSKELCELILPFCENIVCDYSLQAPILETYYKPPHITVANNHYKNQYRKKND